MLSPDDMTSTSTEHEQPSRPTNRREMVYEKRQNILQNKQTEALTKINGDTPGTRVAQRQVIQLREENKRLRWDLEELQGLINEYKTAQDQIEREIEAIHNSHQQELEQYQEHLREMMDERNQMHETYQQLERRYQELYHSFQDAVEEEANKMVSEAARTLVISPEHTPSLLKDVVKTLEYQLKQVEDKHTAEALYLLRETQHKAEALEEVLEKERMQVAVERENLRRLQNSAREQALTRNKVLRKQLQSRWTMALTMMTSILLLFLPILQLLCYFTLKLPLTFSLFAPLLVCFVLAFIFARIRTNVSYYHANKPAVQKAAVK